MAHDIMNTFYSCLNLPLQEKLIELTKLIDTGPIKELQAVYPQLINNIFSVSFNNGWGLRTISYDTNRYDYEALINFFEPQGPMFRLCYRLLTDPQLKYNLPFNTLPFELQMTLERGRCVQFYADMLNIDHQSLNIVALSLNPFDYYIFSFALHLVNNNQNQGHWDNWNSVYFALACDYLIHFLPSDPNVSVLPHIPNYTGKVPMVAPLQTANRPLYSPSLLIIPDLSGITNQQTSPQSQSRNEIWRSETVLQVFIDIWMSIEQMDVVNAEMYQRNFPIIGSSPERVRIVRVLVKHIHAFSAKHLSDPVVRSSALRKYARQLMCTKGYHYVKYLVTTWPLDASFRLVMELWLSLIQPWRYANRNIMQERYHVSQQNQEEATGGLDTTYTQFIAENFPTYTYIFQLVMSRFMRLELTAYKNAVMLFRLGKVFSQQQLIDILWNLEQGVISNSASMHSMENSFNNSRFDQSYGQNNGTTQRFIAVAKQAISELNISTKFEYEPIWSENGKQFGLEFVKKIATAKIIAEQMLEENQKRINQENQGVWASITSWLMLDSKSEDEDCKKVPNYLNSSKIFFSNIFGINEPNLLPVNAFIEGSTAEHSSFENSTSFALSITNKLRHKPTDVHYMGDPDLMPIASYESTILVRILYQLATRINEMYRNEFTSLWQSGSFWGYVAREVLQKPCTIQTFVKDVVNNQRLMSQELPARLSLRNLGSHAFIVWYSLGYLLFKLLSYSGYAYIFFTVIAWSVFILVKASMKMLRIIEM